MANCKTVKKIVEFDPNNFKKIVELMSNHEEYPSYMKGQNTNGEDILISVNEDHIIVTTFQSNGWVRDNVYWIDGTIEELYNGRWVEK